MSHRYRCEIAVPPKGERDWNARILRGGRVQWWGTWRTKRAAMKAWMNVAGSMAPKYVVLEPTFTHTQRARPVKRPRKRKGARK